jgi:hypothetical protein
VTFLVLPRIPGILGSTTPLVISHLANPERFRDSEIPRCYLVNDAVLYMLESVEKTGPGHRVRIVTNKVNGRLNLRQQNLATPAQNPQGVKANLSFIQTYPAMGSLAEGTKPLPLVFTHHRRFTCALDLGLLQRK